MKIMPIEIPFEINGKKSKKFFKGLLSFLGVILIIAIFGYLIYKYYSTKNINFLYYIGLLVGLLGYQLWKNVIKKKLKKSTVKI